VPSSMIFASLVVLWLLILVPAVARHRQEVARPSVAALSGRVLERPRQRAGSDPDGEGEVHVMDEMGRAEPDRRADERDDDWGVREHDDVRWERPPPRYRPGRGGFDPEAAAAAARARYAFRQRVVLMMMITAIVTGVVAGVSMPELWWAHGGVDVLLVGYLVYLRRQVRLEEAIRERRAARMAGTRRTSAADDPELDEWARRGREITRREPDGPRRGAGDDLEEYEDEDEDDPDDVGVDHDVGQEVEEDHDLAEPQRRRDPEPTPAEPALPRLQPAPPPPLPAGTALVQVDEDELELYDLGGPARPDYRPAAGE
jgi:membrane protein implicated in regulation of membrane protease activity